MTAKSVDANARAGRNQKPTIDRSEATSWQVIKTDVRYLPLYLIGKAPSYKDESNNPMSGLDVGYIDKEAFRLIPLYAGFRSMQVLAFLTTVVGLWSTFRNLMDNHPHDFGGFDILLMYFFLIFLIPMSAGWILNALNQHFDVLP